MKASLKQCGPCLMHSDLCRQAAFVLTIMQASIVTDQKDRVDFIVCIFSAFQQGTAIELHKEVKNAVEFSMKR